MEKHFKNIKVNDEFEFTMNIYGLDTCIVNSFRRIVLGDVMSNAFGKIELEINTSIINTEILSHRLSLIPLKIDEIEGEDVCVELNIKNNEYEMISVTSSDLKIITGDLYIIPDILIVKLKKGEEIKLKLYITRNNGKNHAKYTPVSICSLKINEDVSINESLWNKLKKTKQNKLRKFCKNTLDLKADHYLYKNSVGTYGFKEINKNTKERIRVEIEKFLINFGYSNEIIENKSVLFNDQYYNKKYVYSFKFESHLVNPYKIFSRILFQLNQKIINLQNKNIELEKIDIGVCFMIESEGHTMGNILATELQNDPRVKYSYYKMKHPFDRKIALYLILKDDKNESEEYAKILADSFKRILNLCKCLQVEWDSIIASNKEIIEI